MIALLPKRLSWLVVAAALVAGGVIHIASTLAVPVVASGSAFRRLTAKLPANQMHVVPAATPGAQVLPFMSPDMRLAICRYDVGDGPVLFTATLPERSWTISIYTPNGDAFYVAPGQDQRSMDVSFRLMPASERFLGIFPSSSRADADASNVSSPTRQGLIVLRAPQAAQAFAKRIEDVLAKARCVQQKT